MYERLVRSRGLVTEFFKIETLVINMRASFFFLNRWLWKLSADEISKPIRDRQLDR